MTPARCNEASMSEQENSQYVRTHEYISGSAKTRLTTSTPSFYDEDNSLQEVIRPTSHDFQEGEFACPGFFQMVNPENFAHRVVAPDWEYVMRRQAQAILPFLYLGPVSCLKDKAWLAQEGFTLLLAIRNRRSAQARLVSGEKVGAELGIEADAIDVLDNQELISAFPYAIRRINDHLVSGAAVGSSAPGKKIFVFCESGNERSATVVIAYVMVMLNVNMAVASHLVQLRRFCICIEEPLRELLASFQSILDAKRDVQKAIQASMSNSTLAIPQVTVSRKRSIADRLADEPTTTDDDTMGMDMDMDMNMNIMDDGSIDNRKPLAPFQDRSD